MISFVFPIVNTFEFSQEPGFFFFRALSSRFHFMTRRGIQVAPVGGRINSSHRIETTERSKIQIRGIDHSEALEISKSWLDLGDGVVALLGTMKIFEIEPREALSARLVVYEDAIESDDVYDRIREDLGDDVDISMGRYRTIRVKGMNLIGHGVTLRNLQPGQSVFIQSNGLGAFNNMGCGVFGPIPQTHSDDRDDREELEKSSKD